MLIIPPIAYHKSVPVLLGLLLFMSSAMAEDRTQDRTQDLSIPKVVVSVPSSISTRSNLARAQSMMSDAAANASYFDNSNEIKELMKFIKENNLEKEMAREMAWNETAFEPRELKLVEMKFIQNLLIPWARDEESRPLRLAIENVSFFDEQEFGAIAKKYLNFLTKDAKQKNFYKQELNRFERVHSLYSAAREKALPELEQACREASQDWADQLPEKRSQSDTGWCAAEAVADIFSFFVGSTVSTADLIKLHRDQNVKEMRDRYNASASLYGKPPLSEEQDPSFNYIYEGRSPMPIFKLALANGVCLERNALTQASYPNGDVAWMGDVVESINKVGSEYLAEKLAKTAAGVNKAPKANQVDKFIEQLKQMGVQNLFPTTDLGSALNQVTNKKDLYLALVEASCPQRIPVNIPYELLSERREEQSGLKSFFQKITSGLQKGPVLLGLNDGFLYGENELGRGERVTHAVLLTGARWDSETKHCEFRLRNSQSGIIKNLKGEWFRDTQILLNSKSINYFSK